MSDHPDVAAGLAAILMNGHYTFQSGGKMIDLDALLAGLDVGDGIFGGSGVEPP
jgi:hypothetical protein